MIIAVFPIATLAPYIEGSRRNVGLSQVIRLQLLRSQTHISRYQECIFMHISSKCLNYPPSSTNCFSDTNLPNTCQFLEQLGVGSVELLCWTLGVQTLAFLWSRLVESLGSQKSPGRPDIPQEGNLKDADPGHPNMPKDNTSRKQTEQSFGWKSQQKGEFMTFARSSGNSGV